jgi:glucose-1-phosphate thymidylyltransferase
MKIIIPMAGRGSRLRPHTLTVPKPLVPIAGKPMVQRLVEDLASSYGKPIEEIAFIIGDFGDQVEKDLIGIAESLGAKGAVYTQDEPLGTAHAILCAQESMGGPAFIAFADTLFQADFSVDDAVDGMVWVQKVEDPSAFGVIKVDEDNVITDFVEKSPVFVSDLAIVGIYYFKDTDNLRAELQYLIDNNIKDKGEFQLTSALENMKAKGKKFKPGSVEEWLDCGNKDNVVYTNSRILEIKRDKETLIDPSAEILNAVIIPPCYIGKSAVIKNAVIGPHVSIGNNSKVNNSVIVNSVIQNDTTIENANLEDSMLGNLVEFEGKKSEISIGDYSKYSL